MGPWVFMAANRSGYACMRKAHVVSMTSVNALACRKQMSCFASVDKSPLPFGERARVRGGCSRQPFTFATWLACGGLSIACRRPSPFSLLAHATAWSGDERRSRPEGRRAGCPESREVSKRNGLAQSAGITSLLSRGHWNYIPRHDHCRRHAAPAPYLKYEGINISTSKARP